MTTATLTRNHAVSRVNARTLMLWALMAIPLLLSGLFFLHQSLRLDEAQSLWRTSRSVGDIMTIVAGDVHVPLYHMLLHFWRMYVGDSVASARLLSLLFYIVSIPALYALGRYVYSRNVALFATFLYVISPFMNWYANEARMYTLFTLLVIINQYLFLRIARNDDSDHVWAGYVGTAVLGVFTHYFFLLNVLSQAVFFLLRRSLFPAHALKRFLFSGAVIAGSFIPWAFFVLHIGTANFQSPLLTTPSTVNLFSSVSQFLFGFQNDNINTIVLSLWPLTVIMVLLSMRRVKMQPQTEYFILTLLVSIATPFIISFMVTPVFVTRYLIFTIPSLYLLLSSALSVYTPRATRTARYAIGAVMLLMLAIEVVSPTTPVRENYAQAAQYLSARSTPQDTIVLSSPFTIYPVQYYYRGSSPIETLPIWNQYAYGAIPPFKAENLDSDVKTVTGSSQHVFLLLSYDQGYEKNIKDYFDSHYERVDVQQFSRDLTLYEYQLRYDTKTTAISMR